VGRAGISNKLFRNTFTKDENGLPKLRFFIRFIFYKNLYESVENFAEM
jgi:hypothetical protein